MAEEQIQSGIIVSGKRKRAIAKARIREGGGKVSINNVLYANLPYFYKLMINEPISITKEVLGSFNFDIAVFTRGGGIEAQMEAARLAIGKALIAFTKSGELRRAFLNYDKSLLIADIRRIEPSKPGDSKARARRQKSFR